jgi:hypothetical protein
VLVARVTFVSTLKQAQQHSLSLTAADQQKFPE